MKKAFLCHSSENKNFVEHVAKRLGRAHVDYDAFSFRNGQDFKTEIQRCLNETGLFVFFVSKQSLASAWCQFELQEADARRMAGGIEGQLAIIIDRDVKSSDLPNWMKPVKAVIQPSPNQAVRDIQQALFSFLPPGHSKPFVGRQNELDGFARRLGSLEEPKTKVMVAWGLEGIGRRTLLDHASKELLGLNLGPTFVVDVTKRPEDLYLWLADETSEPRPQAVIVDDLARFQGLEPGQQLDDIFNHFAKLSDQNNLPMIVDHGGLLDESGSFTPFFDGLLRKFSADPGETCLALVLRRAPRISATFSTSLFDSHLRPLKEHESSLVLQQLLRPYKLLPTQDEVATIVRHLGGYPPSAYFAAEYCRRYGVALLVADGSILVDFKAGRFSRFLADLKLSDKEWFVLRYLAGEDRVPFDALAVAVGSTPEELAPLVRNLVDNSLVAVFDNHFDVAAPIRETVQRIGGLIPAAEYAAIASRLGDAFWGNPDVGPSIEVVDSSINAASRSGTADLSRFGSFLRVSVLHRLAIESYHRKQWSDALRYAAHAERMEPSISDLRTIQFKSLVKLEQWDAAHKKLKEIQSRGDRFALYLEGFLLRRQHRYGEAVAVLRRALTAGDRGLGVYRELAESLYRCRQYKEAIEAIRHVLNRQPDNAFVLDLLVKIYIDANLLREAEQHLDHLENADHEQRFINHRRASLLMKKRRWIDALRAAESACGSRYAPFEVFSQRIDILLELSRFDEAEGRLKDLERHFQTQSQDVQIGLWCKLHLRRGSWRAAKDCWDRLQERERPVHLALRLRILQAQAGDSTLSAVERRDASEEADALKARLSVPDDMPLVLTLIESDGDFEEAENSNCS